jgi:hypothetical protein
LVGRVFGKEVGSLPVSITKRFLHDSSVGQVNTDGKNMISIDLAQSISLVAENTTQYLVGFYDVD